MGKLNQGPYGGVLGAIGNTIGSVWKGRAYLRIRPLKYNDAKTDKQLSVRNRFIACAAFSKPIFEKLVKTSFEKKAEGISGYNFFMQTNLACFGEDGTIIDYEKLKLSVGNLTLPENIAIESDRAVEGAIRITWDDNSGEGKATSTDRIHVAYLKGDVPVVMTGLTSRRSEKQANVQLDAVAGETVHVYIFFENETAGTFSESFHVSVVIASAPTP